MRILVSIVVSLSANALAGAAERPEVRVIPNQYVVVFKDDALRSGVDPIGNAAAQMARQHGGRVLHVYRHSLRGFAVRLPHAVPRAALAASPFVKYEIGRASCRERV